MSWGKKVHFPRADNQTLPRCRKVRGWRQERIVWDTAADINKVTCLECLRLRGKVKPGPSKDILEEARRLLLARLL